MGLVAWPGFPLSAFEVRPLPVALLPVAFACWYRLDIPRDLWFLLVLLGSSVLVILNATHAHGRRM
ncbi:MAG: hypothetical protein PUF51_04255, partial [Bifidobacteriaceae bacterium]|nr:hypothetical protein [Bifidobacteriaceae bacterium]